MCSAKNIKHRTSTTYHHQSNGKSERFIRFLKNSLGTVVNASMRDCDDMLSNVLFVYKISYSRVLNNSPFFLLYGRDPVLPQDLAFGLKEKQKQFDTTDEYKLYLIKTLKDAYEKVKSRKEVEQEKYKMLYDKKHKNVEFKLGDQDWVYYGLPEKRLTQKLISRFEGPLKVIGK